MRNFDDPDYGWMPWKNLHSEGTLPGAKCCQNLTADCIGPKCMAWRWMWDDEKRVLVIDDDGIEQGIGWCGLAAFPLIGQRPS